MSFGNPKPFGPVIAVGAVRTGCTPGESTDASAQGCWPGTDDPLTRRIAHLKRILRLGRLRLRGPCGAQFEFTLAAIAQNLRRLAKLVARPPQFAPLCAA